MVTRAAVRPAQRAQTLPKNHRGLAFAAAGRFWERVYVAIDYLVAAVRELSHLTNADHLRSHSSSARRFSSPLMAE